MKQVETGSEEGRKRYGRGVETGGRVYCIDIRVDGKRSAIWQLTGPENAKTAKVLFGR